MIKPLSLIQGLAAGLMALLHLTSCGENEDQKFMINGELESCSVIETQACGLTLACDGAGFHQCY